jgi:hypothetical protein
MVTPHDAPEPLTDKGPSSSQALIHDANVPAPVLSFSEGKTASGLPLIEVRGQSGQVVTAYVKEGKFWCYCSPGESTGNLDGGSFSSSNLPGEVAGKPASWSMQPGDVAIKDNQLVISGRYSFSGSKEVFKSDGTKQVYNDDTVVHYTPSGAVDWIQNDATNPDTKLTIHRSGADCFINGMAGTLYGQVFRQLSTGNNGEVEIMSADGSSQKLPGQLKVYASGVIAIEDDKKPYFYASNQPNYEQGNFWQTTDGTRYQQVSPGVWQIGKSPIEGTTRQAPTEFHGMVTFLGGCIYTLGDDGKVNIVSGSGKQLTDDSGYPPHVSEDNVVQAALQAVEQARNQSGQTKSWTSGEYPKAPDTILQAVASKDPDIGAAAFEWSKNSLMGITYADGLTIMHGAPGADYTLRLDGKAVGSLPADSFDKLRLETKPEEAEKALDDVAKIVGHSLGIVPVGDGVLGLKPNKGAPSYVEDTAGVLTTEQREKIWKKYGIDLNAAKPYLQAPVSENAADYLLARFSSTSSRVWEYNAGATLLSSADLDGAFANQSVEKRANAVASWVKSLNLSLDDIDELKNDPNLWKTKFHLPEGFAIKPGEQGDFLNQMRTETPLMPAAVLADLVSSLVQRAAQASGD